MRASLLVLLILAAERDGPRPCHLETIFAVIELQGDRP